MSKKNGQFSKHQMASGAGRQDHAEVYLEKKGFKRAEAAFYLGITVVTIDRLTKRGLLHPSRALRHPIYPKDDLDRFLKDTTGVV